MSTNEKIEVIEKIFASILGQNVKIVSNNNNILNSMTTIKEFISVLYKDTGFNFTDLIERFDKQLRFDKAQDLDSKLNFSTEYEHCFSIKCSLRESVAEIKQRVEDEQAIDQTYQILLYNDTRLEDHKRLRDYGIRNNATLILRLKMKSFYIIVKIHRYITKIIECSQKDTLNMILKRMRDNFMIPNLILETRQNMDTSLDKLGIVPGAVFYARKEHFNGGNLSIKIPQGKTFWIQAGKNDTVDDLKNKIAEVENMTVPKIVLKYNGDVLSNEETLDYYEIQDQSTITLHTKTNDDNIKVNVKRLTGNTSVVNVLLSDTIQNLKNKIQAITTEPADQQCLIFCSTRLNDNNKTLADCNIQDGSTVHSILKISDTGSLKIDVKTLNGQVFDVKLNPDNTIEDLKSRVREKLDMNVNNMVIMYKAQKLEDNQTLSDYGIIKETTVHLLARDNNETIYLLASNLLDPPYDYDFTNINDGINRYKRGNLDYIRPCGWKRIAIKASNQYENDIWLGSSNVPGEWPVAYHGTDNDRIQELLNGVDIGKNRGSNYNKAHLTANDIKIAENFAKTITINGQTVKYVIQSRVNPQKIIFANQQTYMLLPTYEDLRPYGICYKLV